jgi:endonuclease/exonuclease/phosphatase family metal-dependent hydrolase
MTTWKPNPVRVGDLTAILCLILLIGCGVKTGYAPSQVTVHRSAALVPSPALGDSIRVVSWNIQYGEDVEQAVQEIRSNPDLAAADIILLQEMGPEGARHMAEELGMHHIYGAAAVHPHHKKLFGNAVLSRWPIINDQVLILPHETLLTGHRRIAVAADLDLGGRTVRAISIHTATVVMDQDRRIDQAKAVRDSLGGFDGPVILGGDFNTISEYEVTLLGQVMRRLRLKPVRLPEGPTIANKYKKVPGSTPVLDHFFCKEFVAGSRGVARSALASDHYPIWTVLAVPAMEKAVEKDKQDP